MMIAFFLAPVYILVNIYIYWRIMGWLQVGFSQLKDRKNRIAPAAVYLFFAFSFLIAFLLPFGELRRAMKLIGNYWLGVLLYIIFFIVLFDLMRLFFLYVLHIDREKLCSPKMHRRVGRFCACAILLITVGGVINAGIIRVTPYEITVDKASQNADVRSEMRVVLAADLHLGYNIGIRQMEKLVEKNNEQDADLVVFAGDIFDNEWEAVQKPEKLEEILRGIRSRYGVYACYGNHDVEEPILAGFTFRQTDEKNSSPEMDKFLKDGGIMLLRDEGIMLENGVYLFGRADASRPGGGIISRQTPEQITENIAGDVPVLVIDHEPSQLEELADAGVDVDLCGHTHDGQIFPGNLVVKLAWENPYGYLKKKNMHNIVTSGAGLFGPNMRVATKAEICPITIHFDGNTSDRTPE